VITTAPDQVTPAPWVNVLANPHFGTVVSESGPRAYTWSMKTPTNSALPPGSNDPVSDSSGEAFYLRDEERGHFWSPMPLARQGAQPPMSPATDSATACLSIRSGASARRSGSTWQGMRRSNSPLIKVRNESGRSRRISATGYLEWVLGDLRPKSAMHVVTEIRPSAARCLPATLTTPNSATGPPF
jgi:cyclic beta-1,2-glucan synthetase